MSNTLLAPPDILPADQAQQTVTSLGEQTIQPEAAQQLPSGVDGSPVANETPTPATNETTTTSPTKESLLRRSGKYARRVGGAVLRAALDSDAPVARESIRRAADGTPYFVSVTDSPEGLPNLYGEHRLRPNVGSVTPTENLHVEPSRERRKRTDGIDEAVEAAEILDAMYMSDLNGDIDLSADPVEVERLYAEAERQPGIMKHIAATEEGRAFLLDAFNAAGVSYINPDARQGESAVEYKYAPQLMLSLQNALHALPEEYQERNRTIIDAIDAAVRGNGLELPQPSKAAVAARKVAGKVRSGFSRAARRAVNTVAPAESYELPTAGAAKSDLWAEGFESDFANTPEEARIDPDLRTPVDPRPREHRPRVDVPVDRYGVPLPTGPTDYVEEDDRSTTPRSRTRPAAATETRRRAPDRDDFAEWAEELAEDRVDDRPERALVRPRPAPEAVERKRRANQPPGRRATKRKSPKGYANAGGDGRIASTDIRRDEL